jgi:hypothetical protein
VSHRRRYKGRRVTHAPSRLWDYVPIAPRGPCRTPTCPHRGEHRGWCTACAQAQNHGRTTRLSAHRRGYDAAWGIYSKAYLDTHAVCGEQSDGTRSPQNSLCTKQGLNTKAVCVNHKRSPRQGGVFMDPANHEALCRSCNSRHAIAEGLMFNSAAPDVERGGFESSQTWG